MMADNVEAAASISLILTAPSGSVFSVGLAAEMKEAMLTQAL